MAGRGDKRVLMKAGGGERGGGGGMRDLVLAVDDLSILEFDSDVNCGVYVDDR